MFPQSNTNRLKNLPFWYCTPAAQHYVIPNVRFFTKRKTRRSSLGVQEGDIIEPEELENAAYEYVRLYGDGGEMHGRGGVAVLIESVVFTEEKM